MTKFGLSRRHTRKKSRDFMDFDYVETLAAGDRSWLEQFAREYYQCSIRKGDLNNLHASDAQRQSLYTANNERNRDMWSKFDRQWGSPDIAKDDDHD